MGWDARPLMGDTATGLETKGWGAVGDGGRNQGINVMINNVSSGSLSEFDSPPVGSSKLHDDPMENRRRSTRLSYPIKIAHSLSKNIGRGQFHKDPSASTTPAQLRAATVRGEISATEEQVDIERAQRDRNAIHYHAGEAVKAGNDAAAKKDDQGYWIDAGSVSCSSIRYSAPSLQKLKMASEGNSSISSRTSKSITSGANGNKNSSNNGSRMKMPWDAMQSARTPFSDRRRTKKTEAKKMST